MSFNNDKCLRFQDYLSDYVYKSTTTFLIKPNIAIKYLRPVKHCYINTECVLAVFFPLNRITYLDFKRFAIAN